MTLPVPWRLETSRLIIRSWEVADAPHLKAAIDGNLSRLQAWMPWAMAEPSPLPVIEARLESFRADFLAGEAWASAIMSRDESRLLGGIGLHRMATPDALELGYWVQASESGQGYVTEAVEASTAMALALPGIHRIEIHCDPRNAASIAVARRAGFRYRETLLAEDVTPTGEPRDTMVWETCSSSGAVLVRCS